MPSGQAGTLAHSFFSSLSFFFSLPSGRKHYLISFCGCSALQQGDNGRRAGDPCQWLTHTSAPSLHVSSPHPPRLSDPRLSSRRAKYRSPPPTSHPRLLCRRAGGLLSHGARGGGVGNFSRPEPNNLISTAPTRTRLAPPPTPTPRLRGCNSLSRVLYLMTCESN